MKASIMRHIGEQRHRVIDWQSRMTAIPALGPESGGEGEQARAAWLEDVLHGLGLSVERINAPDARVPGGSRPNLVVRLNGKSPRTLWILCHMDVVPPGELALWNTDPWRAVVEGDRIYGRGTEDNQQAIVSALLIASALRELKITPDLSLGLMFVADEETGNTFGIKHLLATRRDLFGEDDMVIAPDYGVADGSQICVSEKSLLWLRVTVTGRQCHASRPALGRNTLVASAHMIIRLKHALEQAFPATDPLFEAAPASTFTPTRHEANVPNVNTVPGKDVFYVDCRVLAQYSLDAIVATAGAELEAVAREHEVEVSLDIVQAHAAAPGAPLDSLLVRRLAAGISEVYGVEAKAVGSGGGTVAGDMREAGLEAVAWARVTPTYHEPNEFSLISSAIGDAQIMAGMLFEA